MAKRRIGKILQEFGLASEEEIAGALEEQKRTGRLLGEILIERKLLSPRDLWKAWQSQIAHQPESVLDISIPIKVSELAFGELASLYSVVPLYEGPGKLTVIMMRPQDVSVIDDMRVFLDDDVSHVLAGSKAVVNAVHRHHPDVALRRCDHCREVLQDADTMVFFNEPKRKLVILCNRCFPKQEKKG